MKLTEICDFLKLKHENHSCFSLFYGKLFGMFKFETISREITYWLTNFLSKFETFATKPKPNIFDIEDQSYFYWKDLIDVLNKTFRENEELKENIEVKFIQLQKEWKITKKE